eukprot:6138602-Pyramimonas_sp.AAC.1
MSKVVLPEQQHRILDFDRETTMRVHVTAAARQAAVVKEGDLPTKACIQANPVKASKTLYIELKTWFDNKCFNIQVYPKSQTS